MLLFSSRLHDRPGLSGTCRAVGDESKDASFSSCGVTYYEIHRPHIHAAPAERHAATQTMHYTTH